MEIPKSTEEKLIERFEAQLDVEIQELKKNQLESPRQSLPNRFLSWLGKNVAGITALTAFLTVLWGIITFEVDRRRLIDETNIAREKEIQANERNQQNRAELRFFLVVEKLVDLVSPVDAEKKYIILPLIDELIEYHNIYKKHGITISSIMIPILLTSDTELHGLRRNAAYAFASGLSNADLRDFEMFLDETQYLLNQKIRDSLLDEESSEENMTMTIVICSLGYTQVRLGMQPVEALNNCPSREEIF